VTLRPGSRWQGLCVGWGVALALALSTVVSAQTVLADHIVPPAGDDTALVINVPQRMLFRFEGGLAVAAHRVGVGRRDWPTPLGAFQVIAKEVDPTWDVPVSIQEEMRRLGQKPVTQVPPGPNNPLGSRWIGLSLRNIGIHGTTSPSSVYRASTHGCIRLDAPAIAALYEDVEIGDRGRVIYEPVLLVQTDAGVLLEAHPDIYRRARVPALEYVAREAAALGITGRVDWALVARVVRERRGMPVDVSGPRPPSSPAVPQPGSTPSP